MADLDALDGGWPAGSKAGFSGGHAAHSCPGLPLPAFPCPFMRLSQRNLIVRVGSIHVVGEAYFFCLPIFRYIPTEIFSLANSLMAIPIHFFFFDFFHVQKSHLTEILLFSRRY